MVNTVLGHGIRLATILEPIAVRHNMHIALTGGLLYKTGSRKDCDLLLYKVRNKEPDIQGFFSEAESTGLIKTKGFGFCYKCEFFGISVDILVPEEFEGPGEYEKEEA